jgi:hypothetical protein
MKSSKQAEKAQFGAGSYTPFVAWGENNVTSDFIGIGAGSRMRAFPSVANTRACLAFVQLATTGPGKCNAARKRVMRHAV